MAFVTAAQVLDSYWRDDRFAQDTLRKERIVRDWLENLVHSYPGAGLSVRGRGLIQGLVTPADDDVANQTAKKAFERGVVIATSGANDEAHGRASWRARGGRYL